MKAKVLEPSWEASGVRAVLQIPNSNSFSTKEGEVWFLKSDKGPQLEVTRASTRSVPVFVLAEDPLSALPGLEGGYLQTAVTTMDHTQPTAGPFQSVLHLSTLRFCQRGTINSGVRFYKSIRILGGRCRCYYENSFLKGICQQLHP